MRPRISWLRYCAAGVSLLGFAAAAQTPPAPQQSNGAWRLVRSANPRGGSEAVSMTRTADISSDRDLAGLMLQCHGTSPEVILIVITPLPPRAQPGVTIGANGREWHFEAQVVPPGAELLLPAASDLATGPWQSAHQLSVQISWQDNSIRGTIPIDGLGSALGTLAANCPPEEAPSNGGRPR